MIQRIQTIYLLLATIILVLLFFVPIGSVQTPTGPLSVLVFQSPAGLPGPSGLFILNLVLLLLSAGLSLVSVFAYGNRKIQIKLCLAGFSAALALSLATIGLMSFFPTDPTQKLGLGFPSAIPFVGATLIFLARRRIQADEELVRSVDRIR